jgi:hypothetical protein
MTARSETLAPSDRPRSTVIARRSGLVALLSLISYFVVIPGIALVTPAAEWDGNGPRYAETSLGDAFFWVMMAAFGVFALAAFVALLSGVVGLVRRR